MSWRLVCQPKAGNGSPNLPTRGVQTVARNAEMQARLEWATQHIIVRNVTQWF
ncbi:hypothetical protein [Runella rosea]|uniref:hypothetical protein n=1 Tax=Runella rosea TaxID=2259595 RepID=UPI0013B438D3|nr:hypothetical protein [Runella rosea]